MAKDSTEQKVTKHGKWPKTVLNKRWRSTANGQRQYWTKGDEARQMAKDSTEQKVTKHGKWPKTELNKKDHVYTVLFFVKYLLSFLVPIWNCISNSKSQYIFLLWRCDPTRVMASSFLRFMDHTQRRTTVGRTPLDEWSARRRDLYLTTHNTHNRQTSMPPVGFEPTMSAGEWPQT